MTSVDEVFLLEPPPIVAMATSAALSLERLRLAAVAAGLK